jgi:hypothetical protein
MVAACRLPFAVCVTVEWTSVTRMHVPIKRTPSLAPAPPSTEAVTSSSTRADRPRSGDQPTRSGPASRRGSRAASNRESGCLLERAAEPARRQPRVSRRDRRREARRARRTGPPVSGIAGQTSGSPRFRTYQGGGVPAPGCAGRGALNPDDGTRPARQPLACARSALCETLGAGAEMPVATRKRERRGSVACSRKSSPAEVRAGLVRSSATPAEAALWRLGSRVVDRVRARLVLVAHDGPLAVSLRR